MGKYDNILIINIRKDKYMNRIFLKKEELSTFERFKPDNSTTSEGIFYFYELGIDRIIF